MRGGPYRGPSLKGCNRIAQANGLGDAAATHALKGHDNRPPGDTEKQPRNETATMTFDAVYTQLKAWGSESYRKILEEQEVRTENLRRVSGKLTLQQRSDNSPER